MSVSYHRFFTLLLFFKLFSSCFSTYAQTEVIMGDMLDSYNVSWETPGPGSAESMPLGNGDIGLNVWVESNGDLNFYISKTDAWSEDNYGSWGLLKLGKIHIALNPRPAVSSFKQVLQLKTGEIVISLENTKYKIWVDANNPVIQVEVTSDQPRSLNATLENWRSDTENGISPDVILSGQENQLKWYHRNSQNANQYLANLTFGAIMKGEGLVNSSNTQLESSNPANNHTISIYPLTAKTNLPSEWENLVQENADELDDQNIEDLKNAHVEWWAQFWNRSWVYIRGDNTALKTTQGYILQRFITTCGGRGDYPIKFNGSIFVVNDPALPSGNSTQSVSADYRTWGGQYWFQNTRAMYWPRLAAGDFDIMEPLFDMYFNMLEDNTRQVNEYYGHGGAYFAETAPFWGGFKYAGPEVHEDWTLHYFTPILELSMMMLDYYEYTGDVDFVTNRMLPVIEAGLQFYDEHFSRDDHGKMLLDPVNSIEMYWKVKNPSPDIAGLKAVLSRLITLPDDIINANKKESWAELLEEVPDLPIKTNGAYSVLLPYEGPQTIQSHNGENPELYAVYPYRLYGMGKPEIQTAVNTFNVRKCTFKGCWSQDPVQAAMLGLSSVAKSYVNFNLSRKDPRLKFPAFWIKGNDYAPDQDNGGNGEHGLQQMIMQADGDKIILMPAWPEGWDCDFKLNAPKQTTIQGTIMDGKITNLVVTPAERAADVEIVQKLSYLDINRSGWTGSASDNSSNAYRAYDDVETTRWDSDGGQQPDQWFMLDFGEKEKFSRIVLEYEESPDDGPEKYEMDLSNDGVTWYGPAIIGRGANTLTEINIPSTNVRYVRFNQTGQKGLYWSIHEMNAFTDTSAVDVTDITIDKQNISLSIDSTQQLTATIFPTDANNQVIFWISDDNSIAKVNNDGLVTGLKPGTTTVKAVSMDGLFAKTIEVRVITMSTDVWKPNLNKKRYKLNLFPNPATNLVRMHVVAPKSAIATFELYNCNGNIIEKMNKQIDTGNTYLNWNLPNLSSGTYLVRFSTADFKMTEKLQIHVYH